MLEQPIREAIAKLRDGRPEFIELFRALANRQKNASVTQVDRILESNHLASLGANQQWRRVAIDFFRELAAVGAGEFKIGRRGKRTRFIWKVPLLEVARVASAGEEAEEEDTSKSGTRALENSVLVTHRYLLRKDLTLTFQLPVDLTASEAERLAAMIRTLPLDAGEIGEDA